MTYLHFIWNGEDPIPFNGALVDFLIFIGT
jgi:hypothetical protein